MKGLEIPVGEFLREFFLTGVAWKTTREAKYRMIFNN